jgi:hypothetical protein
LDAEPGRRREEAGLVRRETILLSASLGTVQPLVLTERAIVSRSTAITATAAFPVGFPD